MNPETLFQNWKLSRVGHALQRAKRGKLLTPRLLQEHSQLILYRTRIGAWLAAFIYVATVLFYNTFYYPAELYSGLMVALPCALGAVSMYFTTRLKFIQKHYHLPMAIILAVPSNIVTNAEYHLTGGVDGFLFFPYFLIFSAMAIFFPATLFWIIVISVMLICGYVGGELWVGVGLGSPRFAANLAYVFDAALICIFGNRFVYKFFIRDKENQIALEEANAKLKDLDKAKSEFFANVSHELKTPMTLVLAPLENALQRVQPEMPEVRMPRQAAESIRHNAYRLSGLISDLLDLTKGEIGKARISPEKVPDTRGYFEGIFNSVIPLMKEKGLNYEFLPSSPLPFVGEGQGVRGEKALAPHFFDKAKIDKVVLNLLSNALKFTPKGGKITMRVWDDSPLPPAGEGGRRPGEGGEGVLKLSIEDTGIGIPADKVSQVFERFMQVDASSTRAYGGMGIGLSLVKDFVEQHGGEVAVESEIGKGSRFTVSLPRGEENFRAIIVEKAAEPSGIELPRVSLVDALRESRWVEDQKLETTDPGIATKDPKRESVLIVDDNPDMLQAIREVLKENYRVFLARDGEQGVRLARERRPDVVISDVMMPKKDGYGLLKDLKGDPKTKEIPVVLLTAKSGEENTALGFQMGADDYIAKPFQPKEVLSRVKNLIRLCRQKEEIEHQRDELGEVNRTLKETEAELVQTEKLSTVGLLAAGIAHEINNPAYALTLSLANLEALLEEARGGKEGLSPEVTERLQHHLKRGNEEIERIKKIVKTLMGYSRKNREGVTIRSFSQDVEATLVLLRHSLQGSGVEVRWNPKEIDIPLEADHGAINQVLTNLIQNAAEAGGHNISIAADSDGSTCRVRVLDDGCGIPSEVIPRIFDPFFTTKEASLRSGLGLNIVHRIVKAHHGEIMVTSKEGSGTEFTLILPLKQPDERPTRPDSFPLLK